MSAREPYDQERIVRQTELHDQPTDVIHTREVVGAAGATPAYPPQPVNAVYEDHVVVERPVYDYASDAVREDVAIDHVLARRAMLDRVSRVVWFVAGLLEALIGLRVVFRLLEANESSGFVRFVYGFTDPFVAPFNNIFNDPASGGAVLDTGALTAMIIYALATWAIVRLLWLLFDRSETGMSRSVRQVHADRY